MTTTYAKSAEAFYGGAIPSGLSDRIKDHFLSLDVPVSTGQCGLTVCLPGSKTIFSITQNHVAISATASSEATLFQARELVGFVLDTVFPEASASLRWTGDLRTQTRPPNFQTALVRSTERIGANFMRVHLQALDVAKLRFGGMHFTLAIPPDTSTPQWPNVNEKGRIVWPAGQHALHCAAYTFVSLNETDATMSFDVFLHEGGRTSTWAVAARPGDRVGIMGPAGGDVPRAEHLLIGGDETALPAIRRIIETAPTHQRASVWLEIGDQGDRLDINCPKNVELQWVHRGQDPSLADCLKASSWSEKSFVWLAAEQKLVREAKAHFTSRGLPRGQCYFATYWSQ